MVTPDSFAEDVAAVVAWSPGLRLTCSVTDLANRLLLTVAEAQAAVDRAVQLGWISLDGPLVGDDAITLARADS